MLGILLESDGSLRHHLNPIAKVIGHKENGAPGDKDVAVFRAEEKFG